MDVKRLIPIFLMLAVWIGQSGATVPTVASTFDFLTAGNAEGWAPTHSLSAFTVANGVLSSAITAGDPYMNGPTVSFSAGNYPFLAIRMKATYNDRDAEIFFTTSTEPNIEPLKRVPFSLIPDGAWHVYFIDMSANAKWTGNITRLRLDPAGSAISGTVSIDFITAISSSLAEMWEFGVLGDAEGWLPAHNMSAFTNTSGKIISTVTGDDPYMHSPAISFSALEIGSAFATLRSSLGSQAQLFWVTEEDPVWNETKSVTFSITPGTDYHDYEIPLEGHPHWKGKVTQLRLDPTNQNSGQIRVERFWLTHADYHLKVKTFSPNRCVLTPGAGFLLKATVQNLGRKTIPQATLTLSLPTGISLSSGSLSRSIVNLAPGASAPEISWSVKASSETGQRIADLAVFLSSGTEHNHAQVGFFVTNPPPTPASIPATSYAHAFRDAGGNFILHSSRARIVAVSNTFGYAPLYFYGRASEAAYWKQGGVFCPVAEVQAALPGNHNAISALVIPDSISILSDAPDASALRFSKSLSSQMGLGLACQTDFSLERDSRHIDLSSNLTASQNVDLMRFAPFNLKVGDGSFGASQKMALFPGVEWLVSGEVSSSTLDIAPPQNVRFAPDPRWITVPSMGILSNDNLLVGLVWEPTQEWATGKIMPAALFASPNFVDGQTNHRMELFAPSIPDYVQPNTLSALVPYPMASGSRISLKARLTIEDSNPDILSLVDQWLQYRGSQPEPYPLNDTLEACVETSRQAFLTTLWQDATKCWQHATGFSCSATPGFAYLLWLDYMLTGDVSARNRAYEAVQHYIMSYSPGIMASGANLHISGWQAPYVFGDFHGSMDTILNQGVSLQRQQRADGSFPPFGDASLYDANDRELGWTARRTYELISIGRQYKRTDLLNSGKKALDHMKTFTVPRAAQTWEIPQHSPDVLAAGHAIEAYVAGYEAFNDPLYIQKAVYWARAGLPFIWMWNPPDWVTMRYGSVPVYGATFYTGSWFGRAVQWNGLVYSHALFKLAQYDSSYPWGKIASGIATSGVLQQVGEAGPYLGTYPDGWNMMLNLPQPVYINPEDILKNVYFMLGRSPELSTIQLGQGKSTDAGVVLVTSRANGLEPFKYKPSQFGSFRITNPVGSTSRVLIASWTQPVDGKVWKGSVELPKVTTIDSVAEGWAVKASFLYLRVIHQKETETISFGVKPGDASTWEFN